MKKITKENEGITLVALILTIILMLILISVATYTGLDTYKNSKVTKFVIQMQLLQAKVDELSSEEMEALELDEPSSLEQEEILTSAFTNQEISTSNPSSYKVFEQEDILNIFELEGINDTIMVNFSTREIVSVTRNRI